MHDVYPFLSAKLTVSRYINSNVRIVIRNSSPIPRYRIGHMSRDYTGLVYKVDISRRPPDKPRFQANTIARNVSARDGKPTEPASLIHHTEIRTGN